jgi:hypothetical protein
MTNVGSLVRGVMIDEVIVLVDSAVAAATTGERVLRPPGSSRAATINQVVRLAGTVVQRALRGHLFFIQGFRRPGFVEKKLSRGYVFDGNSNVETRTLEIDVISHCAHRDGKAFVHKRILDPLPPLIGRLLV